MVAAVQTADPINPSASAHACMIISEPDHTIIIQVSLFFFVIWTVAWCYSQFVNVLVHEKSKEYTFLTNQGKSSLLPRSWLPNYQTSRTNCIRTFRSNFIQKSLNFYNRGVLLRAHSTAYQTADSIFRKWGRNDRKIHNLVFVVLFDESLLRIFSTDWRLSKIPKNKSTGSVGEIYHKCRYMYEQFKYQLCGLF